jgi:hypothetical protein
VSKSSFGADVYLMLSFEVVGKQSFVALIINVSASYILSLSLLKGSWRIIRRTYEDIQSALILVINMRLVRP